MIQIAAIFAEMERSNIRERTRAGVIDAKRRGVKFGRSRPLPRNRSTTGPEPSLDRN
jgi:DNA invertase Pin-like site-specific DNA recombinase